MQNIKSWLMGPLRWSERLFKLDMVYIAKGGFWTSFRFIIGIASSLATMVAFGNLLPKENYGTYSYLLSLGASLGFLTLSGMGPVVIRNVAQGKESILRYALLLQLRYNLLGVATIAAGGLYYYFQGNKSFALALSVLAVVIPVEAAFHVYEHVLIGRKRFDTLAFLTSLSTIGASLATLITLLLTDSVLILVIVFGSLSLFPTLLAYIWTVSKVEVTSISEEEKREIRKSAFHITGAGLIGTLAQYLDKIILFQVAGPASLATYGFAIAGPERFKGLMKNWVNITLPRLAERSIDEIRAAFYKRLLISLVVGLSASLVYIIASPYLFKILLPKYLDSIIYSQVYALGLIPILALVYVGNIFYSQNMLRAIYLSSTSIQVVRIILFVIMGSLWQTWGLIGGFLVTQILSIFLCIYIWEKESLRLKHIQNTHE